MEYDSCIRVYLDTQIMVLLPPFTTLVQTAYSMFSYGQ